MIKKFFEKKEITWTFAIISIISGFFFLDSSLTGNIILNRQNSANFISIIGLLLILCSIVLIVYSIKKK